MGVESVYERGTLNPARPLRGEVTLDLAEDLSLGDEKDEDSLFFNVFLNVDRHGAIWLVEFQECRVHKFDSLGKLLFVFGRKGQGPGEFDRPLGTCFDRAGHFYIRSSASGAISEFDENGVFIHLHHLERHAANFGILEDEGFIYQTFSRVGNSTVDHIITADENGQAQRTLGNFPAMNVASVKGHSIALSYYPRLMLSAHACGLAVFGDSRSYRLYVANRRGEIIRAIEVSEASRPLTSKLKGQITEQYLDRQKQGASRGEPLTREDVQEALSTLPSSLPFFSRLMIDEKGYVFVLRYREYDPRDDTSTFDLFDRDGRFIYRLHSPFSLAAIQDGEAYRSVRVGNEGYIRIQRLKIRNWDHIVAAK
jgi:hypothetical protein